MLGGSLEHTETLWMSGDVFPKQEGRQKCIRIDVFPVFLSGTVKCVYIISFPFKNISAHVWPRQGVMDIFLSNFRSVFLRHSEN